MNQTAANRAGDISARLGDKAKPAGHTKDSDCTLDENSCCVVCHVWHDEECPECGGRGFHKETCEVVLAAERRGQELERKATQSPATVLGEVQTSDRTKIGNTPTCGLCDQQHGTDESCEEYAERHPLQIRKEC